MHEAQKNQLYDKFLEVAQSSVLDDISSLSISYCWMSHSFSVFLISCLHGPFTPKEVDIKCVHCCKLLHDVT